MSEPKLISPMLDGFMMGDAISDHHGVKSCPAMHAETEKKYIVKVISVPASQSKLDALLLAGAFQNSESALEYFKDLSSDIVEEAVVLQRLSRLEGFAPFESWQVVPMDDEEIGFDVYLLSPYRMTLERLLRRESMTHLAAVNLGLDLCAALSVCRRSGYVYANLRPENVYVGEDNEYRIGDLGFVPASSLAYASLPERYLSSYTAPEITDAYSSLNETIDVYSAGLILYQIYNGGELPFDSRATLEPLSPPQYADPDMAQIILKACDPNPEVRWQDPQQMGQALVTYMQSHVVNDTPIVVPPQPEMPEVLLEEDAPQEEIPEEPTTDEIIAEVDEVLVSVGVPEEALSEETPLEETTGPTAEKSVAEETQEAEEIPSEEIEAAEESENEEFPTEETSEEVTEEVTEETTEESTVETDEETAAETDEETTAETDEVAESEEELSISKETSEILAHADDLIAHETPDPVVVPEPVDVPIPEPVAEETLDDDSETTEEQASEEVTDDNTPEETISEQISEDIIFDDEEEDIVSPRRKIGKLTTALICLVVLIGIIIGGYLYYENIYLQPILAMTLSGSEDRLTVSLTSEIADELLRVTCTDTHGTKMEAYVVNGKAYFNGLNPGTRYKIQVEMDGFHKLVGKTTQNYDTAKQTSIIGLSAVTGMEDGSAILNFSVQGPEEGGWIILYSADGEEEKTVECNNHMATITGLTIGKEYTFRLKAQADLYVVGINSVTHTASKTIVAEDLKLLGFQDGALSASWSAPADCPVTQWIVRCYNNMGYDETITTEELRVSFEGVDIKAAYTIEVTAAGMTQSARVYVSENSITISDIQIDNSDANQLTVSWEFVGDAPKEGWLLMYTIDNDEENQFVLQCADTSAVIVPKIPGSVYHITIQPAGGISVIGGTADFEVAEAAEFSGYWVNTSNMTFRMCKTPDNLQWGRYDIPEADYKTTFTVGEKASFAVYLDRTYDVSQDEITTLFVFRDADGKLVKTGSYTMTWTSMWYRNFGRMNLPVMPDTAGAYTLDIYFNGAHVTTQSLTIV